MDTGKDRIVVTGATGKQGGAVARELLAQGHLVRAITRKPDATPAKQLAQLGAEVVAADLDDEASLARALEGAFGVFAVQNTWEAGVEGEETQGKRLASLARDQGVQHYVYSSVGSAHRNTGIPHFDNKWRIEEHVRSLGFPSHTVLRPVFFMENFLAPNIRPGLLEGKLAFALSPSTVLQMVAVEDIGKLGLRAFEQHAALNGAAIDLAGDQHTMPEVAAIVGKAIGRDVRFVQQPIEQVRAFSEDFALMLEWFERVGYDVDIPALEAEHNLRMQKLAGWAPRQSWK